MSGKWREFADLHTDPDVWRVAHSDGAGLQAAFLPWHRVYLRRMERELQKIDPGVTIPYWNWALDSEDPLGSPVLSDDFFGSTGDPENSYCVVDGSFGDASNETCVQRGIARDSGGFLTLADLKEVLMRNEDYGRFVNTLENGLGLHGHLHMFLGGNMANVNSPKDPLFYVHHSFVDMLWWRWQKMHNRMGSPAYKGNASAPLYPFKESASDVFSAEEMGYTYSNPLERDPKDNATIPCYLEKGGERDIVSLGERVWTSLPDDVYRIRSVVRTAPRPNTRFFTEWQDLRTTAHEMQNAVDPEMVKFQIDQVAGVLAQQRIRSRSLSSLSSSTMGLGLPIDLIVGGGGRDDDGPRGGSDRAADVIPGPGDEKDEEDEDECPYKEECGSCLRTAQELASSPCVDTYSEEFREKLTVAIAADFAYIQDEPLEQYLVLEAGATTTTTTTTTDVGETADGASTPAETETVPQAMESVMAMIPLPPPTQAEVESGETSGAAAEEERDDDDDDDGEKEVVAEETEPAPPKPKPSTTETWGIVLDKLEPALDVEATAQEKEEAIFDTTSGVFSDNPNIQQALELVQNPMDGDPLGERAWGEGGDRKRRSSSSSSSSSTSSSPPGPWSADETGSGSAGDAATPVAAKEALVAPVGASYRAASDLQQRDEEEEERRRAEAEALEEQRREAERLDAEIKELERQQTIAKALSSANSALEVMARKNHDQEMELEGLRTAREQQQRVVMMEEKRLQMESVLKMQMTQTQRVSATMDEVAVAKAEMEEKKAVVQVRMEAAKTKVESAKVEAQTKVVAAKTKVESAKVEAQTKVVAAKNRVASAKVQVAERVAAAKERTATRVKEAKEKSSIRVEEARSRASSRVEEARSRASSRVEEARSRASSKAAEARSRASSKAAEARSRASSRAGRARASSLSGRSGYRG
ncbi:tyrosinase [Chloropicon primus]|uniref:Tyrosinase n=1 Tax=Chloropicon primus TaxID=1764295 RepID=A0A5B8MIF6_9CHLO|nr:tyrosinase [Chloropicon primus]|eukprot:QDZ20169.1 tyrosinase [Chloropicon primus]